MSAHLGMRICSSFSFVIYFIGFTLVFVQSELFTAVVELQNLLYTEGEIVKTLEKYLELEEQRLEKVRRLSKEYDKLYKAASNDVETFLSNPVNAYLLVKRLTADWKAAENLIDGSAGRAMIENITHRGHLKFPDDEDLSGAASALMRLQDTYLLDTSTLARGHIEGTAPSPGLTSGDCFELGRQAYNVQDYYHTVLWMQEALDRLEKENIKTASKADVLEYMAYSTYMLGNIKHAERLTKDLLDVDPDHPRARGNLAYYTDTVSKSETQEKGDDGHITSELMAALAVERTEAEHPEKQKYEKLCRGESMRTPAEESELKCRYFTNNHPFLILQPAKEEELNLDPRIVIYHNVLSDREMDIIKFLATPRLARAGVLNSKAELEISSSRIGKNAWLRDDDHEVVRRVSQRIEAITGLTTDTAEELQVVNYGIGGYYETHFDFASKGGLNVFESLGTGNRIATWINYMSDVDAGGSTVFPAVGVAVKPIKGSAAFWFNLFKNGDGNVDTKHAACPVLAGSKWISNKWLHENGQEFIRPCGLNPDE